MALQTGARSLLAGILLSFGVIEYSCVSTEKTATRQAGGPSTSASPSQEPLTVEWCTLLKNPLSYHSKVIRIRGTLGRFRNYMTFYDSNCVPKHPLIKVVISPSIKYETGSESSQKLSEIISGSHDAREGNLHVRISGIGVFKHLPPEEQSELQYEFFVMEIEEIAAP